MFGEFTFPSIWQEKDWQLNRSAKRLLIVSTNLVWQITDDLLPNLPIFSPTKLDYYTVSSKLIYNQSQCCTYVVPFSSPQERVPRRLIHKATRYRVNSTDSDHMCACMCISTYIHSVCGCVRACVRACVCGYVLGFGRCLPHLIVCRGSNSMSLLGKLLIMIKVWQESVTIFSASILNRPGCDSTRVLLGSVCFPNTMYISFNQSDTSKQ